MTDLRRDGRDLPAGAHREAGSPSDRLPLVTVGLPVYNGERFVEETIRSLLAQDFDDFELIVADNASTDATGRIALEAASRDPRVRYLGAEANRGAAWNFNRCVEHARGRYFKWAAHDDTYEPTYLSRCVAMLERDPGLVLAHTRASDIDEAGEELHVWEERGAGTHTDPVERFRAFLDHRSQFLEVFGVMRIEVLRRTPLIGPYSSSDVPLMAELGLQGRFGEVDEVLFHHREHPDRSIRVFTNLRERAAWFDTRQRAGATLPTWRTLFSVSRAAVRAPITASQRIAVGAVAAGWGWRMRSRFVRELAYVGLSLLPGGRAARSEMAVPTFAELEVDHGDAWLPISGPQGSAQHPAPSGPVSVVVMTTNDRGTLNDVLRALAEQTYDALWEVVVVDDRSVDASRLAGWRHRLPRLQVVEFAGLVEGRSPIEVGVNAAKGDLLIFCKGNQVVSPNWLTSMVKAARHGDLVAGQPLRGRWGWAEPDDGVPDWALDANLAAWRSTLVALAGWGRPYEPREAASLVVGAQDAALRVVRAPEALYRRVPSPPLLRLMVDQFRVGRVDDLLAVPGSDGLGRSSQATDGGLRPVSAGWSTAQRIARRFGRRVGRGGAAAYEF